MKHPVEVCPLSRGVMLPMAQPLSLPLQQSLRFFYFLIPAGLSVYLTVHFPPWESYGLTLFREMDIKWVRLLLYTDGICLRKRDSETHLPCHTPFGSSLSAPLACRNLRCLRRFTSVSHTTHPSALPH